ncbi:L-type lectin-domain containing receptor kinase SIT2-like isoform X2 [Carex rostrata]
MLMKNFALTFLFLLKITFSVSQEVEFTFNGFTGANLTLDGVAYIESNGLLRLTNDTSQMKGHSFYPSPIRFGSTTSSFSTTFVFAITSEDLDLSGHGIAFFISPSKNLSSALPSQYLGLLNIQNNGNPSNHIFAIELDTIYNSEFQDINDNHVGIDINSLKSTKSAFAGYYADDSGAFQNLSLISSKPKQVWVEYDSQETQITVALSPIGMSKPRKPLLSYKFNLSTILNDSMYIGFSSSTGSVYCSHYILGWSFKQNGVAPSIDLSKLPKLPRTTSKGRSKVLHIVLPFALAAFVLILVDFLFLHMKRRFKYAELLEDWEVEFGPHRFSYKDLYRATNGFKEKKLLGSGGFGKVYKGVLPVSKLEVAVKRISHESKQGTMGYLAPELARTGKATPLTDVFAFGAFLLEVVCSKRPVEPGAGGERTILVDQVLEHWKFGSLADIVDPKLDECYNVEEVDMVLKLGLLCSHPLPSARLSMQQVVQYLEGNAPLPELSAIQLNFSMLAMLQNEGFDSYIISHPSTMTSFSGLSGGR